MWRRSREGQGRLHRAARRRDREERAGTHNGGGQTIGYSFFDKTRA
jgi:hypothetical protein